MGHGLRSPLRAELFWLLALTLLGALLRLWMLGSKGLWYDEASTALMARAAAGQIVQFHWDAAVEHPPLWVLFMHFWSKIFGQGEAALRLPSAFTGALAAPMAWQVARTAWPGDRVTRLLAAGLVATAPALILYAQEARMYSLVAVLALVSVYMGMRMLARPYTLTLIGFVLANWLMLGLHYYSALLVAIESAFLLAYAVRRRRLVGAIALAAGLSIIPFLLWAWLAPGFHTTLDVVLRTAGGGARSWGSFPDGFWRDLAFGSVRWQPPRAAIGYLLLPLLVLGAVQGLRKCDVQGRDVSSPGAVRWGILFILILVVPLLVGLALASGMATRYILWVVPFAYLLIALGIDAAWRLWRPLGVIGLLIAAFVAVLGLGYYFTSYQKSDYREMALYLTSHAKPYDGIILEAPRQHLLAKYYLPAAGNIYPMPAVDLPDYWPVTAPPLVPEEADHQLQTILAKHGRLWVVLTGENEVDQGEFVDRYLTAIAYPVGCRPWLDVRLCQFISPDRAPGGMMIPLNVTFDGGLNLAGAQVALEKASSGERLIYVALQWHAREKPVADYKSTLRMLGQDGKPVSQGDSYPIGPLLPPTTWSAGDDKPGYTVLEVPETVAPGEYHLAIGLYDPASLQLMPFSGGTEQVPGLVKLASVKIDSLGELSVMP
jgi:4-amino-4-deoxy-L-arabinose transferase-like glycosyltransferase